MTWKKKLKADGTYHAPEKGQSWALKAYSDEEISEWANDENCLDRESCQSFLRDREAARQKQSTYLEDVRLNEEKRLADKRNVLLNDPFDPRTEVSADAIHIAKRIVKTLWIIFILIPIVLSILYALLTPSH